MKHIGRVRELVRYPIKSLAGVPAESAFLGWHGLAGDRRFAFRRVGVEGGFPWLTASRLPELVRYRPIGLDEESDEPVPTHVRTPAGSMVAIGSVELAAEVAGRLGGEVELMRFKNGIFDEAAVSLIAIATIAGIGREAGVDLDRRRFRANVFLETEGAEPFLEDAWIGSTLAFGHGDSRPAVTVTMRDERCLMVDLDPDTGKRDPRVQKAVVRLNDNTAGVYATVVRTGAIRVGDAVWLAPAATHVA